MDEESRIKMQTASIVDFFIRYPYLIPAVYFVIWITSLSLIARLSGWSELADYYAADTAFAGKKRRFLSLSMKHTKFPVNYNSIVNIGADGVYLYLDMFLPFRPSHPPLKIPLSDLSKSEEQTLKQTRVAFRAQRAPDVRIAISRRESDWIFGETTPRSLTARAEPVRL